MLTMNNGIDVLKQDMSCHSFCDKLKCDGWVWNHSKWRCKCSKCNGTLNEDAYECVVKNSSSVKKAGWFFIVVL